MATGQVFLGSRQFAAPSVFSAPLTLVSGSGLVLAAGVPFAQAGTATVPPAQKGAAAQYTTAAGQPGYVNPQGLVVLDSGVVSGSPLTSASTLASFTAEAQIMGLSIPAGDPAAAAVYSLRMAGVYGATGSTPTYAFGLRYGGAAGTSIAAIPAITIAGALTNAPWDLEAVLQFYDTTHAVGFIRLNIDSSAATDLAATYTASPSAAVSVTSATAKVMSVTVTCSASSATNTISALTGFGSRLA